MWLKKYSTLLFSILSFAASAQNPLQEIPLPKAINGVGEEYSGMAVWKDRLYLLPQYGGHKDSVLRGDVEIYSIRLDSIRRVITGKDTALTAYRTLKLTGINQLSDTIRFYQGFEAIAIVDGQVFLSIETDDEKNKDCYVISGALDIARNRVIINPRSLAVLPRFSFVPNAGFESLTWLPKEKKLLALFEFNASPYGNRGYLLDKNLSKLPQVVSMPFSYFRITDAAATTSGIYALNYFWSGDYKDYLNNCLVREDASLLDSVPPLRPLVTADSGWLRGKNNCLTRILKLSNLKGSRWVQEKVVETGCSGANWEGIVPFDKGFLIISDANIKSYLRTALGYVR